MSKYGPQYLLLHVFKVTLPPLDRKTQLFNLLLLELELTAMTPLCLLKLLVLTERQERAGKQYW